MFTEFQFFISFIFENFLRIWPYLLITIPIAVAVRMSGASNYIRLALSARPAIAILLATIVGAFSPFCSCTVIPIVAAMLIGGVPLAPVMAFWIASPSMDPEIFFLSVGTIGWEMAVWRLAATLVLSLSAGYVTQLMMSRGWLGDQILRERTQTALFSIAFITGPIADVWQRSRRRVRQVFQAPPLAATVNAITMPVDDLGSELVNASDAPVATDSCCSVAGACGVETIDGTSACNSGCTDQPESFWHNLARETWAATTLVIQFMFMAFVLEAFIIRYIPAEWITTLLGHDNPFAIVLAAVIGVPVYTSNLAALPMVGGLMAQGMSPAAGLAFLVAGPTTTLPAMAAVWQLASRRVFVLYVGFSLVGAIIAGYIYQICQMFQ